MSLGPNARSLLDAAEGADDPSAADAARVRRKLVTQLALGAAAGTTAATVTKTATASAGALPMTSLLGAKVVLALALVGGAAVTGAVVMRTPTAAVVAPSPTTTQMAPSSALSGATAAAPTGGVVAAPNALPAESTTRGSARELSVKVAAPPKPSGSARAGASTTDVRVASSVGTSTSTRAAPEPNVGTVTVAAAPPAGSSAAPKPPTRDTVAEEAALLRSANAALARGDGAAALTKLDEHAAHFPYGALTQEREAARVLALCASGRVAEARAASSTFVAANPRSPLASQVRRACATTP